MTGLALFQHVIVWLPLVIGGIFLIRAGLRGRRINDHPICRRCRFDLVGLPGPTPDSRPDRCPECGTSLTGTARKARLATIDGERRRRWWAFSLGLGLLLAGLATGFWLTYKPLAKFPWTTWAPDWVLAEMADSPSTVRATLVGREIVQRLQRDTFAESLLPSVVAALLRVQANPNAIWASSMGDVIELGRAKGLVSDPLFAQYARNASAVTLEIREHIGVGDPIPWTLHVTSRAGSGSVQPPTVRGVARQFGQIFTPTALELEREREDQKSIDLRGGLFWYNPRSGSAGGFSGAAGHALAPGAYNGVLRVTVLSHEDAMLEHGEFAEPPIEEHVLEFPVSFSIVTSAEPRLVSDESRRPSMQRAFVVERLRVVVAADGDRYLDGQIRAISPVCPYAFDVFLVADGRTWSIGQISGSASGSQTIHGLSTFDNLDDLRDGPVTVVLEPSLKAATATVGLTEIWGEKIVMEAVPLVAPPK